ncbi:hypothetical protein RUM43_003142 [Polyplax serrata]|uniref:Uncharacterized protein n=1 Tax=Polyplax serrata TaxID=468196 RepID=A0AAN8NW25_POLSC
MTEMANIFVASTGSRGGRFDSSEFSDSKFEKPGWGDVCENGKIPGLTGRPVCSGNLLSKDKVGNLNKRRPVEPAGPNVSKETLRLLCLLSNDFLVEKKGSLGRHVRGPGRKGRHRKGENWQAFGLWFHGGLGPDWRVFRLGNPRKPLERFVTNVLSGFAANVRPGLMRNFERRGASKARLRGIVLETGGTGGKVEENEREEKGSRIGWKPVREGPSVAYAVVVRNMLSMSVKSPDYGPRKKNEPRKEESGE